MVLMHEPPVMGTALIPWTCAHRVIAIWWVLFCSNPRNDVVLTFEGRPCRVIDSGTLVIAKRFADPTFRMTLLPSAAPSENESGTKGLNYCHAVIVGRLWDRATASHIRGEGAPSGRY